MAADDEGLTSSTVILGGPVARTPGERAAAYETCRQRGHTSSGITLTSNPPWLVCRYCGTNYRFTEPQLVEMNAPEIAAGEA